jgi:Na+/H+-dicarboxylate symporter
MLMKDGTRVLVALAAALAVGGLISISGSPSLTASADYAAPIGTLWVNAIRMTVIPLVVSLIITGVASAADVATIGRTGVRTLVVFVALLAAMAVVMMPLCAATFALLPPLAGRPPLPPGAAAAAGQLSATEPQSFAAWLTSLIPANPVAAAASGQMVPLILFTLLLAGAVAASPAPGRATLMGFFQSLADAMLTLVRWVIAFAPIGVFALVLPLAAHAGTSLVGAIGFYILAYSAASVVATLLLYPVALVAQVGVADFARAALPAQIIAFSSSSSIAALPAVIEGAERELRVENRVAGFVAPLAVSTFKIAGPVSWTVGALFVARFYGVPLHVRGLATIAFAAVFLAFAVPGIPRGAFIMLAPLFAAIGLPVEGIGILIAVDVIPDTFATVLNTTGNLMATALVARGPRRASTTDVSPNRGLPTASLGAPPRRGVPSTH